MKHGCKRTTVQSYKQLQHWSAGHVDLSRHTSIPPGSRRRIGMCTYVFYDGGYLTTRVDRLFSTLSTSLAIFSATNRFLTSLVQREVGKRTKEASFLHE